VGHVEERYCCLSSFSRLSIYAFIAKIQRRLRIGEGKKKEEEEERKKKPQDENIMSASATQVGHNNVL